MDKDLNRKGGGGDTIFQVGNWGVKLLGAQRTTVKTIESPTSSSDLYLQGPNPDKGLN